MGKKEEKTHAINELEDGPAEVSEGSESADTSDLEELTQAVAAKTEEVKALQDKYLRLVAEFDNFKKLTQKEQREYSRFANENLLKELLPVLDNLERAIKHAKDGQGTDGLIQGVELTHKQFTETLAKFGVKPFVSLGARFDPSYHQAVARKASQTVAENTVIEEYQKGYLLHDRVLRAAMVAVAVAPEENNQHAGENAEF